MLYDGTAQNYSTNPDASIRIISPPLSTTAVPSVLTARPENVPNQGVPREPINNTPNNSCASNNTNPIPHHRRHHVRLTSFPAHSSSHHQNNNNNNIGDLTTTQPGHNNTQQHPMQQNNRPNSVGRCPFISEGHHYNRPRRLQREFFPVLSGRPYAVHEDLWRRQYHEQEVRRHHYWSNSPFNNETPEVQVHMVHMDHPSSTIPHRLTTTIGENNNSSTLQADAISRYRMQRQHRRFW